MQRAVQEKQREIAEECASPPLRACRVSKLSLVNFRNFARLALEAGDDSVVLTGRNGSGKTTILEALSLLTPGRGLRGAKLSEIERRAAPVEPAGPFAGQPWAVAAIVRDGAGMETPVGTGRNGEEDADRRIVKINGMPQRGQSALAGITALCWLTPQMSSLFLEGAAARRFYLDRLAGLFYPDHARHLAIYDYARAERQRLLRHPRHDPQWLDVLERRMAEQAVAIAAARRETVCALQESMREGGGVFPAAALTVKGAVEQGLESERALAVEARLEERLRENRAADAASGRTEHGTHRSNFMAYLNGLPAEQCSTGEQKSALLAITLASARARRKHGGDAPALLLDEVVAHLDERRRAALFEEIRHAGAQSWLTGTDRILFKGFKAHCRFFSVAEGGVSV